jgi:hypothetical protein
VPAATEAMRAVDGLWWDSTKRIPDFALVRRRNFEIGAELRPWLVPPSKFGEHLRAACGPEPATLAIVNPDSMNGVDFSEQASLVIDLPDHLAAVEPFRSIGRRITQKDFPRIVAYLRGAAASELGPMSDVPDIAAP